MDKYILGCNIDFRAYEKTSAAIKETLSDGVLLSEITQITGVPASTVQNWVKRGYIANPDGKKYAAEQTADIILLNNLKNSVELSDAADLINKTKKKSGVKATEILGVLASSIIRAKRFNSTDRNSLQSVINMELRDFSVSDKAVSSLVMITALSSLSADYKKLAQDEFKAQ